ncbi:MAG: transposase, partial [Methylobacter sp.]
AFNIANEANLSEEELELQHKKKDWIYIQKSSIELAAKTGLQQGLQQGLEQGFMQGESDAKIKMVLNAHKMGLPMQTISELTGLDEDGIMLILREQS